jgi:hypothetical protein
MRLARPLTVLISLGALGVAGLASAPAQASNPPAPYQTVVDGLRNPRGLTMTYSGKLFVAEGGEGGDICFAGAPTEGGGELCAGLSSRISQVNPRTGQRSDFITGLMSLDGPLFAVGATGVAARNNQVFGLMGGNDQFIPPAQACGGGADCKALVKAAAAQLGHLLVGSFPGHDDRAVARSGGHYVWRQDVGAANYQWTIDHKNTIGAGNPAYQPGWADNPDFQPGDANPYALTATRGGTYSVDGGSNTLTWVPNHGQPRVVVAFPNPDPASANAYDSVPTCVAKSGDKIVVADLNGQIFVVDGSSITVAPAHVRSVGGAFLASAGGCAADRKGHVFISDIFAGGLVKLSLHGMSLKWVRPPGTFNFPSGIALGNHGALFMSNNSVCPSFPTPVAPDNPCGGVTGSIVRINRW